MEYQWIKNKRYKNVSIRIKEGQIIVTSPVQTSKEFVDTFVNQHTHWIQKQLAAYEAIPRIRPGMTLFILERPYKVVMGDVCAIDLDKETITIDGNEKHWQVLLKEIAQNQITPRFHQWEQAMGYSNLTIRYGYYASKWGSCRKDMGVIALSTKLLFVDWEEVDSVIVHELCHMKYPNHSQAFYQEVLDWMPNYWEVHKHLIHHCIPVLEKKG
ncbi:M48 family metallopeptidase [Absicoccus porci]|uniref:M48 family metallopeptidase n=1 Tax=Absicoccus porci TaxID=2486576 RepID=UPI003F8A01DD